MVLFSLICEILFISQIDFQLRQKLFTSCCATIYPAGTQFFRFLLRPLIRSMIISMASWGHLGDFFFHFFHFYHFNSLFLQCVLFLLFLQCLQFLLFLFLLLCSLKGRVSQIFFILSQSPLDIIYGGKIVETGRLDLKRVKKFKNS